MNGAAQERSVNLVLFSLISVIVGVITGFGAIVFRILISEVHNVLFFGHFSSVFDANIYTPASPWGWFVILVPVVGGLGVVFLVNNFAPEARGHGVPEVMDAIFYKEGRIRPAVVVVKSLASALAIGSGSSVGREGPIIQIGSALGSNFAQLLRLEAWQRITLVAAGAGAGIAATFNTPIGGVIFAIELMMPEFSTRTFLPVALSTGTATFIGRLFFGPNPAFHVPPVGSIPDHATAAYVLVLYAMLGVLAGVGAAGFIRGLHFAEDTFERIHNSYLRHAIGMGMVGLMMVLFLRYSGHYQISGVGYATIEDIMLGGLSAAPFLALLFVSKLAATSLSLGSGSSGGIFSPSLYMGATLGGAFGAAIQPFFPAGDINVPAFAMVGMAAMVGGGTGAAMTAVTMIFEMTLDYAIVLPMIIAVAISIGCRRILSRENIYTIKLVSRRHFIPKALHANMFLVRRAEDVMDRDILVLPDTMGFDEFLKRPERLGLRHIVVVKGSKIVGVLRVNTALRRGLGGAHADVSLGDVASRDFTLARRGDVMFNVIGRMWRRKATMAIVTERDGMPRADNVMGVISKEHVADSVAESVKVYAVADHPT